MSSYKKKYICHCLGVATLLFFLSTPVFALDIIPGLKGFGTDTRAAYGAANTPEICIVDSLLTTTGNPKWDATTYSVGVFKGTLIQCLEGLDTLNGETIDGHVVLPNSGKIILFETSGTIRQKAAADDDKKFRYKIGSYTTIAGQTSPNPGILLRNICIFGGAVNDVLIQHVRGRMDGPPSTNYGLHKSFVFTSGSKSSTNNIVVDHVSSAWGADAQIEFYKSTQDLQNITMSNCILAEARENMGLTDEESNNGKNCLIGGPSGNSINSNNILVYGNLFSNSRKRNPRIRQSGVVFVNNYSYNNSYFGIMLVGVAGTVISSVVGNVLEGGPMSGIYASDKTPSFLFSNWVKPLTQHQIYLYDNKTDLGTQSDSTDWLSPGFAVDIRSGNGGIEDSINIYTDIIVNKTNYIKVTGENPSVDAPLWPAGLTLMASSAVKDYIIANAGAYPAFRDSLDTRFISEMTNGTGPSSTVKGAPSSGDWPTLAIHKIKLAIPPNPHADDDGDGYTNLEEWLHSQSAIVEGKSSVLPPTGLEVK